VAAIGSSSLLKALLTEASAAGSCAVVVGMPPVGVLLTVECGIELTRLALRPNRVGSGHGGRRPARRGGQRQGTASTVLAVAGENGYHFLCRHPQP
jgi:hypothetical protein